MRSFTRLLDNTEAGQCGVVGTKDDGDAETWGVWFTAGPCQTGVRGLSLGGSWTGDPGLATQGSLLTPPTWHHLGALCHQGTSTTRWHTEARITRGGCTKGRCRGPGVGVLVPGLGAAKLSPPLPCWDREGAIVTPRDRGRRRNRRECGLHLQDTGPAPSIKALASLVSLPPTHTGRPRSQESRGCGLTSQAPAQGGAPRGNRTSGRAEGGGRCPTCTRLRVTGLGGKCEPASGKWQEAACPLKCVARSWQDHWGLGRQEGGPWEAGPQTSLQEPRLLCPWQGQTERRAREPRVRNGGGGHRERHAAGLPGG